MAREGPPGTGGARLNWCAAMPRRGAAQRLAAPLLLLLILALHVRPGGCGKDNVLQRLWSKAPLRRSWLAPRRWRKRDRLSKRAK